MQDFSAKASPRSIHLLNHEMKLPRYISSGLPLCAFTSMSKERRLRFVLATRNSAICVSSYSSKPKQFLKAIPRKLLRTCSLLWHMSWDIIYSRLILQKIPSCICLLHPPSTPAILSLTNRKITSRLIQSPFPFTKITASSPNSLQGFPLHGQNLTLGQSSSAPELNGVSVKYFVNSALFQAAVGA